jgi:acetoin utilization deacetylase AcuC-like enzyme
MSVEASTAVVKDEIFLEHRPSEYHPESPKRLEVLYSMLKEEAVRGLYRELRPRPCERDDLLRVHTPQYVDLVSSTAGRPMVSLDPDTQTSPRSYEAALHAAGGCLEAIDRIMGGEIRNCFAMIRPPGHHAEASRAMGFCLFNNVAVAARYAQTVHGIERVMIVDWDLHHGNGTQRAFYDDASVLYASTHQYPYYPGTGAMSETGAAEGEGYTINVPLSPGHGDAEYVGIYRRIFAAVGRTFRPDLLIISAGFDIYHGDPLGGMRVSPEGFGLLLRVLNEMAREVCEGRVLVALEGGYDLVGLREGAKMVLMELAGVTSGRRNPADVEEPGKGRVDGIIEELMRFHGDRWGGALQ